MYEIDAEQIVKSVLAQRGRGPYYRPNTLLELDNMEEKPREEYYEGMPVEDGPMSRGEQTFIICAVMIVLALAIIYFMTRTGDPCQTLLGGVDLKCRVGI